MVIKALAYHVDSRMIKLVPCVQEVWNLNLWLAKSTAGANGSPPLQHQRM